MQRQGTCNLCGQCCGAVGGPDQRSPFPTTWYPLSEQPCWRHWEPDYLVEIYPILSLLGIGNIGEDTLGIPEPVGLYKITNERYYYVWVPGKSVCKDTSVAHDGSSHSVECPFLKPDPGDGTRPCGLVGTKDDGVWKHACEPYPPLEASEEYVTEWTWRYPGCSYSWTE